MNQIDISCTLVEKQTNLPFSQEELLELLSAVPTDSYDVVKSSKSRFVVRIQKNDREYYLKRYLPKSGIKSMLYGLGIHSKAKSEFLVAQKLEEVNIRTFSFLGVVDMIDKSSCPARLKGSILVSPAREFLSLFELWPKLKDDPVMQKEFLGFLEGLHQKGIYHVDLSAHHIGLVDGLWGIVDVDGLKIYQAPLSLRRRMVNYFQIAVSLPQAESFLLEAAKKKYSKRSILCYNVIRVQKQLKRKSKRWMG